MAVGEGNESLSELDMASRLQLCKNRMRLVLLEPWTTYLLNYQLKRTCYPFSNNTIYTKLIWTHTQQLSEPTRIRITHPRSRV